jgi:hypothetical protein
MHAGCTSFRGQKRLSAQRRVTSGLPRIAEVAANLAVFSLGPTKDVPAFFILRKFFVAAESTESIRRIFRGVPTADSF